MQCSLELKFLLQKIYIEIIEEHGKKQGRVGVFTASEV